jgi:hypothetical protein
MYRSKVPRVVGKDHEILYAKWLQYTKEVILRIRFVLRKVQGV